MEADAWAKALTVGPTFDKLGQGLIASDRVVGEKVVDACGEEIGKVGRIFLDKSTAAIAYVVLRLPGILGFFGRDVAAPWSSFSYSPERQAYEFTYSIEDIERAPRLPHDLSRTKGFAQSVDAYYRTLGRG